MIVKQPVKRYLTAVNKTKSMELLYPISPNCIAVYCPFHVCEISFKDKSENIQEIDNNQNEIILFPPSSLFINVGLKEITSASLCKFFYCLKFISKGELKVIKLCPHWSSTL